MSVRGAKNSPEPEDVTLTDTAHLSPEIIAAYLAGESTEAERRTVQYHLLDCANCRQDVAEATALTADPRPRRWAAIAIPAAAAAAALFLMLPGQGGPPNGVTVRGPGSEGVPQFAVVTPADGAPVIADSLVFVWRSEGPGAHYVLTVTDESGDVVWTAATADTLLVPPRAVGFASGRRYYWYVDALLDEARSSTTGIREFTIRP